MRFDLTDLKLFLLVVEAGSITAGAERMHLAVAAASTRIRNMEIELGTPLLNRDRQGVQPTPAGRTLIHHARLMLQQAERMRGELSEYADGLKGHVRLLSNTNALTEFLPEPLSNFLAAHPQVNIDLEERLSDEIVAAIADGKADIGIVAGTEDVSGLEVFPFRTDRFVLVTAPDASARLGAAHRIRRRSGRRFRRPRSHQLAAAFPVRQGRAARPTAQAASAAAQLRLRVPPGRVQRRRRRRARNHCRPQHEDHDACIASS